jgi:membrane-associated protease RseP (regulator of RpoE activity)
MLPFERSTLAEAGNLRAIVGQVMNIADTTYGAKDEYAVRFRGQLIVDSVEAYARVAEAFRPLGYTPLFRKDADTHVVYAVRGVVNPPRSNPWINVVMLVLTVVSMLFTGGTYGYQGPEPQTFADWMGLLLGGWPFLVSLLAILLAHELGHYFAARYHKVAVTLPYFIPLPYPLSLFGTLGAFIQLKAPPTNRRVLLDIGIAGPLAGFVVAVPVVLYGLATSPVQALPPGQVSGFEGNSILYVFLKYAVFGKFLPQPTLTDGLPYWLFMLRFYLLGVFTPSGGSDVILNQVAWAGWAGLLVTGLNLIPAGQLDGGHALYTLIGRRARLAWPVILVVLGALGLFWMGWWLWVALIFFLGRVHAEPLDQITELDPLRKVLAASALLLFLLVITPIPFA